MIRPRIKCWLVFCGCLLALLAPAQTSWKGTSSTAWGTATNWTAGVPNASVDAVIGDTNFTGAFQPTVNTTAACKSLAVGAGAKASTLTVSKALTVSGHVLIGAAGTVTHSGAVKITLTGNWTNAGTYNATANGATVAFSGVSAFLSGATTFKKLTINAGSATALTTNITVGNLLTVTGTLDPGLSPTFSVAGGGKLTVSSGGSLLVRAATFAGNYALTGTKTFSAGSTVDYAANGNQTVDNAFTYRTLRISGSGTKTLAGNLPALSSSAASQGNLFVAGGTLDLSTFTANRNSTTTGGTLSVAGGATLKIGGGNSFPARSPAASGWPPAAHLPATTCATRAPNRRKRAWQRQVRRPASRCRPSGPGPPRYRPMAYPPTPPYPP